MAENGIAPKKKRAAAALLLHPTIGEAAKAAGVGERTLARWLADDALFQAEVRQAEGALIDAATRRLLHLQAKAVEAIERTLDDPATKPTVKLRAAVAVLDQLVRLRELRNMEERISALEAAIKQ